MDDYIKGMQNEVKKEFYKERTKAHLKVVKDNELTYESTIGSKVYTFRIPIKEVGSTPFYSIMEARHLIRWLKFSGMEL